jgi:hypothetical protein
VEPLRFQKFEFETSGEVVDLALVSRPPGLLDFGGGGRWGGRGGGREGGKIGLEEELCHVVTCGQDPALGFYSLENGGRSAFSPCFPSLLSLPPSLRPSVPPSLPPCLFLSRSLPAFSASQLPFPLLSHGASGLLQACQAKPDGRH